MSVATTEIEAVTAWIDGRLDLAFDDSIGSDLRQLSLEAQSQSAALVQPAYAEMLKPLRDALRRGHAARGDRHRHGVSGDTISLSSLSRPLRSRRWQSAFSRPDQPYLGAAQRHAGALVLQALAELC